MITLTERVQEIKHIWYDICYCESCLEEAYKVDDDEDFPKKWESSQQKLKKRYEKGDSTVGLLGEPSRKFDYYSVYPDIKIEPHQPPLPHKPPSPYTLPSPHKLSPHHQTLYLIHKDSPPTKR
ncbi:hypothetical protein Tco_0933206 [Tanacetum coccineum]